MTDIFNETEIAPVLAKKKERVFASLIDLILSLIVAVAIVVLFGERYTPEGGGVGYHYEGPLAIIPFLFWFVIVVVLESINGQSFGKRLMKIKVVSNQYQKASFGQIFVRHLFDIVDWAPGFGIVGLLVASNNPLKQRVGDLVAKTMVVKKKCRLTGSVRVSQILQIGRRLTMFFPPH